MNSNSCSFEMHIHKGDSATSLMQPLRNHDPFSIPTLRCSITKK